MNILASTLFGCISGSSVADTASIGSVMIPQMVKAGYPRVFATNVTICGSVQALLIPPSHNAVIYSLAAGGTISVAHLFLAGIFPGLLFGLCLIGLVLWTAHKRGFPKGEPVDAEAACRGSSSMRCGAWSPSSSSWAASSPACSRRPSPPRWRASTRSW